MTEKVDRSLHGKSVRALSEENNPALREMGTVQVRHMLCCSLAVATYTVKDVPVNFIVKAKFCAGGLSHGLLNGGVFLEKFLATPGNGQRSVFSDMLSVPTTMQMLLFFYGMLYVEFRLNKKTLGSKRNARVAPRAGLVHQVVVKECGVLTIKYMYMSISDTVQTYMLLDRGDGRFFVIISCSDGYAPLGQVIIATSCIPSARAE